MQLHKQTIFNRIGKILAKPLSHLVANATTEPLARLAEAYLCILLGKGAGTGWAMDAEIKAAKALITKPAPIIFDVGANIGEWSFRIHQLFPQASIFMFEPQPECQKQISVRNIAGATLIPHAVSSVAGQTIKLHTSYEDSGIASLHKRRDSYFQDQNFTVIDVKTVTLDEIISQHQLPRVDFLKMDVEGHELAVIEGAMKGLENHVIKALSFEFGSGNINSRTFFHDFWDRLIPLGYRIYRILPSSRLMPIKEYYEDCEYFRGVTNYIALA